MSKCRCDNIGINLLSRNPLPEIPTFKCYHWNFCFKWFSWFSSEYIGKLLQTFPAAVFWLLKWSLVPLSKDVHGCLSVKSGRNWSWIFSLLSWSLSIVWIYSVKSVIGDIILSQVYMSVSGGNGHFPKEILTNIYLLKWGK